MPVENGRPKTLSRDELVTQLQSEEVGTRYFAPGVWGGVERMAGDVDWGVTREPLTYERDQPDGSRASYFCDLALGLGPNRDPAALKRLHRHAQEMSAESEQREKRARYAPGESGVEYRVTPNSTLGQGGYFTPPLWLIDQFATAPRPGQVLNRLVPKFALPRGCASINVPRLTTGTAVRALSDTAAVPDQDILDAQVQSEVVTVSGSGDTALQLLEQSPRGAHLDWAMFKDLTDAYDAKLEEEMVSGSGANGELLGLLNVKLVNAVEYTAAEPVGSTLFPELGKAIAQIGKNRKRLPEAWLIATSRWAWLATSEDKNARPLLLEDYEGLFPIGSLVSIPAYMNDALPRTLGEGANQEAMIACRPSDLLLLESEPVTNVMEDVLSGTLEVRFQLHARVAAINGRYPSGISKVTGKGMIVQEGF